MRSIVKLFIKLLGTFWAILKIYFMSQKRILEIIILSYNLNLQRCQGMKWYNSTLISAVANSICFLTSTSPPSILSRSWKSFPSVASFALFLSFWKFLRSSETCISFSWIVLFNCIVFLSPWIFKVSTSSDDCSSLDCILETYKYYWFLIKKQHGSLCFLLSILVVSNLYYILNLPLCRWILLLILHWCHQILSVAYLQKTTDFAYSISKIK